jgi:hypothetical protein
MKGLSGNGGSLTRRARTRRRRALDAMAARILKMPPGHDDYILTQAVRVPMRDGVELLTDIYAPVAKSLGTLLIRTPYGRSIALLTARYYASHGYHVVTRVAAAPLAPVGISSHSGQTLMTELTLSPGCEGKPGSADDSRCAERLIWGIRLGP